MAIYPVLISAAMQEGTSVTFANLESDKAEEIAERAKEMLKNNGIKDKDIEVTIEPTDTEGLELTSIVVEVKCSESSEIYQFLTEGNIAEALKAAVAEDLRKPEDERSSEEEDMHLGTKSFAYEEYIEMQAIDHMMEDIYKQSCAPQ